MLKIRTAQIDAFASAAESAFENRLLEHVRATYADEVVQLPQQGAILVSEIGDDVLRLMVRGGIARARHYHLTWESSIGAFVALMFTTAPSFDSHPLIARALQNTRVAESERFDLLWQQTNDENWQRVVDTYDATGWTLS